ncbi:16S rRNA (adenine(1518)-N(6)/adenine(1519)-N(6))-dimethyltransferase RsmA [Desulfofundulus salinus]|uniref:Ribosomal RNA small subunit methyltransferase A n=1 Tax=Desulfofundulus salinus TaxID=2419843 RepID=A0A494X413_9FIRM|nr:16S rRNA (adenine(1518)-N(6)/adenine(1519)-N(6))-dimethyltransferase RsmA [Desulfofundulus salinum]RKO67937.1 16S rRNA (adenine(1518)-N(6)/adenine(1519)-N(6))-dimethyltransferase RsmA [Desulfofundulus salinum]
MSEQVSFGRIRAILEKHNIRLRKSLGQNFLMDGNIVRKIVTASRVAPGDVVVEIGPGAGTLTAALAGTCAHVVAVELDKRLLPVLEEVLGGLQNVTVVSKDALEVDFDQLVARATGATTYKVVANLPYYITTPLIMHLLRGQSGVTEMVLMIQLEVADRLVARPGSKDYGAFTVTVQYYCRPEILFRVPRTVFFPQPEVDSAVVRLAKRQEPEVAVDDEDLFFTLVRGAFGQRRKTLANALAGAKIFPGWTRAIWEEVLKRAGIDPRCRGETLGLAEFAALARACRQRLMEC